MPRGALGNSSCSQGTPGSASDPSVPKVLKGGSHLCDPNYCQRYRPAAKWVQPIDTAITYVGLRYAKSGLKGQGR